MAGFYVFTRQGNSPMYVEKNCCIEHEGRKFCAGGAVVTPAHIVAYPGKGGILNDWHGNPIGTWRTVSRWPIHSWIGSYMHQIEATVNGTLYTGRGFGEGMLYRGKVKKG